MTTAQEIYKNAKELRDLWQVIFTEYPGPVPTISQFYLWLGRYPVPIIEEAINSTLMKTMRLAREEKEMSLVDKLRYASATMRNINAKSTPPAEPTEEFAPANTEDFT